MRKTTLIFASLLTASLSVSAGQSVLESGTTATEGAAKSTAPSEVTEGAKTLGKANAVKKTAQNPTAAIQDKAQEKAGEAAVNAIPGAKAAKETTSKAKAIKDATEDPSSVANKAVESGKSKAKAKAVDSALEMMH